MCVPLKVEENYNGGGITESLPVLLRCGSRNSLILSKIQRPFDTAPFSISPLSEMRNPMYHSMFRRMAVLNRFTGRLAKNADGSAWAVVAARSNRRRHRQSSRPVLLTN